MSKIYPQGIVGEQHYQDAVKTCRTGERVFICHEPDNPHDELALKVETAGGQTIGYLPKDCWIREAVHEQGRGVTATILSLEKSPRGFMGVVLNVTLTDDEVRDRSYRSGGGALAGLIRKIFR